MPLHPALQAMIEQMAAAGGRDLSDMPPVEARQMYRQMNAGSNRQPVSEVNDRRAGEVPVRIYRPAPGNLPCLIYFHGGGWVIGDLETHDPICRALSNATGCVVIATDYRLAPEHPYPAPLLDCYNTLLWVHANAEILDIDPQRIALGGDSAGGNLSACVAMKLRDDQRSSRHTDIRICHQLLVYPCTDKAMDSASYTENAAGYMLSADTMQWFWQHYLQDASEDLAYASPMQAETFDGLPPATVITAEFDPLRDEGEAYARKLQAAGGEVHSRRYAGMVHGFFAMADLLEDGRDAIAYSAQQLKRAFGIT